MFLLLAIGCSEPQLEDLWTDAWAICDPPQPFVRDQYADTPPSPPSQACEEVLVRHFGVREEWATEKYRTYIIEALYNLLARDMGNVADLEVDTYVREPFIGLTEGLREELGTDDVRQLYYNFAALYIDDLYDSTNIPQGFRYDVDARSVRVNQLADVEQFNALPMGESWALSFIHEASHAVVPPHTTCVDDFGAELNCDLDWDGAYGVQAATGSLMDDHCDPAQEAFSCLNMRDQRDDAVERIVAE